MSAKGLTMSVVAVAVAAGTYFGLKATYPAQQSELPGAPRLAAVDEIFNGELQPPGTSGDVADPTADVLADTEALPAADAEDAFAAESDAMPAASEAAPEPALEPEPEFEPEPELEPEFEPEPAPAPATRREPPAPKPAAAARPQPSAPSVRNSAQPTQWWGPESDAQLSVLYAGSAAYTRAIVLMFNGAFDDTRSATQHLRVTDANGKAVSGSWQLGTNSKRMLLFPVSRSGVYTVSVGAALTDRTGRALGQALKGPVRIQ